VTDKDLHPNAEIGPARIAPAAPTAEGARVSAAVREGLAAAAAPGSSLTVASLRVKVPHRTSAAEITRAVHEALARARTGRRQ
jgi:hypothetical protein